MPYRRALRLSPSTGGVMRDPSRPSVRGHSLDLDDPRGEAEAVRTWLRSMLDLDAPAAELADGAGA